MFKVAGAVLTCLRARGTSGLHLKLPLAGEEAWPWARPARRLGDSTCEPLRVSSSWLEAFLSGSPLSAAWFIVQRRHCWGQFWCQGWQAVLSGSSVSCIEKSLPWGRVWVWKGEGMQSSNCSFTSWASHDAQPSLMLQQSLCAWCCAGHCP